MRVRVIATLYKVVDHLRHASGTSPPRRSDGRQMRFALGATAQRRSDGTDAPPERKRRRTDVACYVGRYMTSANHSTLSRLALNIHVGAARAVLTGFNVTVT